MEITDKAAVRKHIARRGETMTETVNVTAEDIANGKRGDSCCCPVALALRRAFPDAKRVRVGGVLIADERRGALPLSVKRFMRAFDNGREPKPFTFTVDFAKCPQ